MILQLATAFIFFLNINIGFYSRDNRKRGKYALQTQHSQNLLGLHWIVNDELTIKALFLNLFDRPEGQTAARMWMGNQYSSFFLRANADEVFDNILSACQTTSQQVINKLRFLIIRLVKAVISDHFQARFRTVLCDSMSSITL
jgi:hypothetical protein